MENKCVFCGNYYVQPNNSSVIFISGAIILFGLVGLRIKIRSEKKTIESETQTNSKIDYILLNDREDKREIK